MFVLNASPWRASDDTIFGTKSLEGEDEELGMQLVVETSIFNYNAELPPSKRGRDVPLATCHDRDQQPLANIALKIHKKLAEPNFVDQMVERMKNDEALGEKQMSPFYYTFEDRKLAEESHVVTSWTIKTDIGSGSSRTDFDTFGPLQMNLVFLTLLSVVIAFACWILSPWSIGKRSSARRELWRCLGVVSYLSFRVSLLGGRFSYRIIWLDIISCYPPLSQLVSYIKCRTFC